MATNPSATSLPASPSPSPVSEPPSRASGSRDSLSAPPLAASSESKGLFHTADTTFNPAPYALPFVPPAAFDAPQATAPPFDGMFIHPPFNNLPDSVVLTEGMNYGVMHEHPRWFLDIRDYVTLDDDTDRTIRYPRDLEPPRPRKQKDLLLRCTFCPRTYAGVNGKSMWTRHVREKHRVVLSKAWSDNTATSARRKSTTAPLVIDTAAVNFQSASPLTSIVKTASPAVPKCKPGPK
ncbi:hypothetical protein B0H17DRAFT_983920, partial [Mycena rosella]